MSDNVNKPSHYNAGSVETIDAIKSALGDAFLDYCRGNVLRYVWRCRHKGKLLEDLRKAAKYLEWAIAEAENDATEPTKPEHVDGVWVEEADANAKKIEPTEWIPKVGDKVRVAGGLANTVGEVGIIKAFCPVVNGEFLILKSEERCVLGWFQKDDVELIEAAQ